MPGTLNHSPGDIIQRLLIQLGLAVDPGPPVVGNWPAYASQEPDGPTVPNNCITTYDTQGRDFGRKMIDGERQEHHGFQLRIRSTDHTTGYRKARALATGLDTLVYRYQVSGGILSPNVYCVHSISRTSDVIRLGKEAGKSKRDLFTVNATAYILMTG